MKLCRAGLLLMPFLAVPTMQSQTPPAAQPSTAAVAATPPMGWNSWDSYGLTITEDQFRANVKVLHNGLMASGYNYAVIDEGWFFFNPEARPRPDTLVYAIDANGRYVPVPARFPSAGTATPAQMQVAQAPDGTPYKLSMTTESTSFKPLADWVHAQGLKFGIHIVRGIPRVSVERNLPIAATAFHAADAADTTDACPWDPTNWGIKNNAAGQAWYDSLISQYAGWGVDLLKVDCIAAHPYKVDEIQMIRRAIDKTGRPMVLSLSPGPTSLDNAAEVGRLAQMWRISDDFWDVWASDPNKAFRKPLPASSPRPPPGRPSPNPATGPTPTCCRWARSALFPAMAHPAAPASLPTSSRP
jgi:alpha-galactosidase